MKLLKVLGVLVVLAGVAAVASGRAGALVGSVDEPVAAQGRAQDRADTRVFELRGGRIGVSARDLDAAEADRQKLEGGVVIGDVVPDSPAAKAGLKPADVVVEFDGERVRSARQFARLVQETPPGRTVKVAVVRDGKRSDLQLAPAAAAGGDLIIDGDRLRDRLGDLAERLPDFEFDLDLPGMSSSRGRLGVSVQQMTDQLAAYFGAKEGVLVAAVTEGSAAQKAGLKAGDVITSVNGERVRSRIDLTTALRHVKDDADVTIGIVRDKKESSLKARLEPTRPARSRRSI